jgi:hypothetical protein
MITYCCLVAAVILSNLVSWIGVCKFVKQIPMKLIVKPTIIGIVAASIGYWGCNIIRAITGH